MVNSRIIFKIISQLLLFEMIFMLGSSVVSLIYREDDVMAFLLSAAITTGAALIARYLGRDATNNLSTRDAYLVVTSAWTAFSVFGMLPYLISGYITNITDAFFESMSGFTTTGATIIDDVECLPHGMLFWRSLTQWIGGLGIVFFTIAVLPSLVGGNMKVFAAEATGPIKSKMHPRLSTTAKWIWSIYSLLTITCILSFHLAGMGWFDSVCYSMTTNATGGFAPHNESVAYFKSPLIEYIEILFQFLAGINFILLYTAIFKRKWKDMYRNSEFRLYVAIVTISTIWISWLLVFRLGYDVEHALRCGLFQVVSFITTTGLFNDDAGQWPHITWVILGCCMFAGACAGSTSGGFKCVRSIIILKVMRNEFKRILHPNAVLPVKINGVSVPQSKVSGLLAFFAIYVLLCLIAATIMIMAGIDNTNAITIALSCVSNVGPTLGTEIGPVMSWSILPDYIKNICSFLMLMGRLEIMSVLVIFTRSFWNEV